MRIQLSTPRRGALVLVPAGLLVACGGGGGGSAPSGGGAAAVVGLTGPSEVTVVTANEQPAPAAPGAGLAPGSTSNFDAGDEYYTDAVEEFVYDSSLENLETINMILGMSSQTAYSAMVNRGAYLAQVDESLVGGNDSGQGQGQASADLPQLQLWTVDSTRASNTGAQTVRFWVPLDMGPGGPAGTIRAEMTLTASAGGDDPFGQFVLNFAGVEPNGSVDTPVMFGQLRTLDALQGFMGFSFYESMGDLGAVPSPGDYAAERAASVNMTVDKSQGVARILNGERYDFGQGDSGVLIEQVVLAFDDTHMLSQRNNDAAKCYSRTAFAENVYRYDLYHASGDDAGSRVDLAGGFNFVTDGGEYGWAGYHGLWVPDGVALSDGDVVQRFDWATEQTTEYTVVAAPGRLIRNTRQQLALSEIVGDLFEWWDFTGSPGYFRISWSGTEWQRVAQFDDQQGIWVPIDPPTTIALQSGEHLGLWSPTLGGAVNFVEGDTDVTFFAEEYVDGQDAAFLNGEIVLYGFDQMLASGIDQQSAESGAVYLADAQDVGSPHTFSFTQSDLTLRQQVGQGSTQVGLAPGVEVTQGPFTWGMRSGPMVSDLTGVINTWDLWKAAEFYVYETGHNPWNQYQALLDTAGDYATFDPPIQFAYTHSTAADRNGEATFDGKTYMVGYGGSGDLFGIPYVGVDVNGDNQEDQYLPQFGIADGTLLGPTGSEYVIKARDIQLTLEETPGECGSLSLGGAQILGLPDGSDYSAPTNGAKPVVTDPPAVIAGEVVALD